MRVRVDDRDNVSPGWKFNEWELKGVPIRIEIGPKDLEKGQVVLVRRDTGQKTPMAAGGRGRWRCRTCWTRSRSRSWRRPRSGWRPNCRSVDTYEDFKKTLDGPGGFVFAPWCGSPECEARISDETKATIRLIPDGAEECPRCIFMWKISGEKGAICPILLRGPTEGQKRARKGLFPDYQESTWLEMRI